MSSSAADDADDIAEYAQLRSVMRAIEEALAIVDDMRAAYEEACEIALLARDARDATARATLADRYNRLIAQAASAPKSNPDRSASPWFAHLAGLEKPAKAKRFAREPEITAALESVDRTLSALDAFAEAGCREAKFISVRHSLTQSHLN
ncbi:MAG: hypothetical protein Tsb0010_14280 [Parvularculaceae bacterium]